jgi:hypothetical protein
MAYPGGSMKGKPRNKINKKVLHSGGFMNGKVYNKASIREEMARQERFMALCSSPR